MPNPENVAYLRTKRERMGHLLGRLDGDAPDWVAADSSELEGDEGLRDLDGVE